MAYAGVHLFLANKLKRKGLDSQSYFFGNLIPDVEHLMRKKLALDKKYQFSKHSERGKFEEGFKDNLSLREGIKIHFLVDDYVHENYIPNKIKKFKKWDQRLVHFLTEVVMDRVLVKRNKKIKKFYDEVVEGQDLEKYGEGLEKIFPDSKFEGSKVLKDGIEMLRVSNLSSWLKMSRVRKIVKRYNPFKEIYPNILKLFYVMKKIENEVKKDLDEFLDETARKLKKKI